MQNRASFEKLLFGIDPAELLVIEFHYKYCTNINAIRYCSSLVFQFELLFIHLDGGICD